MTRHN